ncbi:MAG: thiamine pyrophosphate-dependent dehydrogenase E1 component subunit alpha [Rhodospirillales bacterium]|jgi:pyruvate dehydrogenase E1 component alpha subunit|nr:thiamine pyrophosphate-dependent dehydrogenase E1 component subunit alpha [Rhodospirillales bacterium]
MYQATEDPAIIERIYRSLRVIRRVEEEIARLYPSDKIKSPVHLSIGQESVAVGVCDPLNGDDFASGTYRGHATYLAKGGDLNAMMAELFGKSTGCAGGKAGSMHLIDIQNGVLGASAVVGTTIPVSVGFALAFKREGKGRVVACFFGDGATEEGVFAESLNFAALHRLPVLFVCENNGYAIHAPLSARWATDRLRERVATYGIPTHFVPDSDTFVLRDVVEETLPELRSGRGPVFVECLTYRWREHVGPSEDYDGGYRTRPEAEPWLRCDPVEVAGARLEAGTRTRIDADVEDAIAAAIGFAEQSPDPDPSELLADVFAD